MQTPLLIEELVIDDSFINYCYNRNHQDIQYWENYVLIFPDQKANLNEARLIVLGMSTMFLQQEQEAALTELRKAAETKYTLANKPVKEDDIIMALPTQKLPAKRIWMYIAAAAVIGVGAFFFIKLSNPAQQTVQPIAQTVAKKIETLVYTTNYGEKKTIWLPDSSKVILNAKSTLRINENFGVAEREVNLIGEALFDVTHNEKMPFVVNMKHFDVKVLGTLFNVKAYEEDRIQEASLIRGKVQVIMKNNEKKTFFLNPNEKAIIPNKQDVAVKGKIELLETSSSPTVTGLTINNKDNSIIETSWVYDRLDISDKTFFQISTDLERLYNVTIEFKDKKVSNYRFSATFEKETIEQVLQALQLSYPFHYTIDDNSITISK
jgi:transmembrane sensor